MRLTTKSRYGAKMFLDIALHCDEGPVRIRDISRRQGISVKYLEKLIRKLRDARFIESRRGPKGGHLIARPLEDISVGDLVRVLEGRSHLTEITEDVTVVPARVDDLCLTRRVWVEAAQALFAKLDSIPFSELVAEARSCNRPACCLKDTVL
ncbi:RrF2 family transcriptional regulator [Desulfocurvus sp. DL9XJH121]